MSRLDELIAELCPDGVEYKTLGEIATDIFRGAGITREQIRENGTPCVRYGEIYTTYNIYFEKCVSFTDENIISSKKYFEYGDILFAITGERVDDIAKSCAYIGKDKCLAGGDIAVLKHSQNPKYMAYALSTKSAQEQKSKGKVKSKVVHSSIPSIKEIRIPLPPLPVQEEIVRILDTFSELTAELTAELSKRKQQYQYYSQDLSSKYKNNFIALGGIAEISTGSSNTNEEVTDGEYPFFVRSQEIRKKDTWEYDETAIITAGDGVGVGKVFHYVEGKYALHQRAYRIHIFSQNVLPKYFFYYMKNTFFSYITQNAVHASVTSIRKRMLDNYPVPVPPLEEQERIVAILDRFDTLCNDLTSGLPAEIEARKKQYEYYRDKLLTFKEAV